MKFWKKYNHALGFKVNRLIYIFIFCQFSLECKVSAQSIELYHCMVDLTDQDEDIMKHNGIKKSILIDGRYIDPNNTGHVDSLLLVKSIANFFPDQSSTGLGILDWENFTYDNLCYKGNDDAGFISASYEWQRLITIAKEFRPMVKWGLYNLPYSSYWKRTDAWRNHYLRIQNILQKVDILMPSIYDYYSDTTHSKSNEEYEKDVTMNAIKIGYEMKKPVYAFIWHQWHESNPKLGLELIPENEFQKHLTNILETKYKGRGIDGLVWFGAQSYFYRIRKNLIAHDIQAVGGTPENVKQRVLEKYGRIIAKQAN